MISIICFGLIIITGIALFEPNPFNLLLIKAEKAATPRTAPLSVRRHTESRVLEDTLDAFIVDPIFAEWKHSPNVWLVADVALARFIGTQGNVIDDRTIANVVFPTGIDRRDDLGQPDRFDVYYGMADNRIGVARLDMPDVVPSEGVADSPHAKV